MQCSWSTSLANRVGDIHVEVNVLDGQRTNLTKAATGIKQQTDYRGIALWMSSRPWQLSSRSESL